MSQRSSSSIATRGMSYWSALALVLWRAVGVNGQHTEATCSVSSLSWSFNSLNQSPCLIAANMANPCASNDNYDVPGIGPGFHYNPSPIPSVCECNSVVYSLYSACAACQNATIGPWTLYTQNCTQTWPDGQYLLDIPPNTALPAWAYQLVTSSNRFNLTEAQAVGDMPENKTAPSSTTQKPTQTLVPPGGGGGGGNPTTGTASAPANTGGNNNNNNGSKKSTPVGAIAGGVVGGVAGLALIGGLLAFFLMRRKKSPSGNRYAPAPPTSEHGGSNIVGYSAGGGGGSMVPSRSPAVSPGPQASGNGTGNQYTAMYHPVNPVLGSRPYDPEDPSTFPPTTDASTEPAWSVGEPTLISNRPLGAEHVTGEWNKGQELRAEV